MGCLNSTPPREQKVTWWTCQYCSRDFATFEEADRHEKFECPQRPQIQRQDSSEATGAFKRQSQNEQQVKGLTPDEVESFESQPVQGGDGLASLTVAAKQWQDRLHPDSLAMSGPEVLERVGKALSRLAKVSKPAIATELDRHTRFLVSWRVRGSGMIQGESFDNFPQAQASFASRQDTSDAALLMDDYGKELQYSNDRQHFAKLKNWCSNSRVMYSIVHETITIEVPVGAQPESHISVVTPSGLQLQLQVPRIIPQNRRYDIQYPIEAPPTPGAMTCLVVSKCLCTMLGALEEALRRGSMQNPQGSESIPADEAAKSRPPWFKQAALDVLQLHTKVVVRCNIRHAKQALLFAKLMGVTGLDELEAVAHTVNEVFSVPPWWDMSVMEGLSFGDKNTFKVDDVGDKFNLFAQVQCDAAELARLQALFDGSFRAKYTRDRRGEKVPKRLILDRAVRVQNAQGWAEFTGRQDEIRAELARRRQEGLPMMTTVDGLKTQVPDFMQGAGKALDGETNGAWLFHGTTAGQAIAKEAFLVDLAGSNAGTLYGRGIYLAESVTKSDEYSKEDEAGFRQILVCRACLGNMLYCDEKAPNKDEMMSKVMSGQYHSVLGDREKLHGTFREFVVYDEDQIYPEFVVWYRRGYDE